MKKIIDGTPKWADDYKYTYPVSSISFNIWPEYSIDLGYKWCARLNDGPIYISDNIYHAINLTGISLGDLDIAKLIAKKLGYDFQDAL